MGVALTLVLLDQWTKYLVRTGMHLGESVPLVGKTLALTYIHNYGGAFGVFQGRSLLFLTTGVLVTAGLLYSLPKIADLNWLNATAYALILGGAVGNLIDRSRFGYVVDFVEVGLPGPWGPGFSWAATFPCFNVADSGITVGIATILIWTLFSGPEEEAVPASETVESALETAGAASVTAPEATPEPPVAAVAESAEPTGSPTSEPSVAPPTAQ